MKKKQILVDSKWLKVILETVRFPDSTLIKDFYIVERPPYAAVVPLIGNREILLVQQYRHGSRQNILNIPMGVIDKNEKPVNTARRELLEETGYRASIISSLGTFQNNPAFLRLTCHLFLARNLIKKPTMHTDTNEHTEIICLPLEKVMQKIFSGEIQDMTTAIGIFEAYLILTKKFSR